MKEQALLKLITGFWGAQIVCVAAKLGVADCFPGTPLDTADLARKLALDPVRCLRLARALASLGILTLISENRFDLTPLGALLRSDHPQSMRSAAIMYGGLFYDAWGQFLHSVETGETAWFKKNGSELFVSLQEDAPAQRCFNEGMASLGGSV